MFEFSCVQSVMAILLVGILWREDFIRIAGYDGKNNFSSHFNLPFIGSSLLGN
jgi:hypothetical protein